MKNTPKEVWCREVDIISFPRIQLLLVITFTTIIATNLVILCLTWMFNKPTLCHNLFTDSYALGLLLCSLHSTQPPWQGLCFFMSKHFDWNILLKRWRPFNESVDNLLTVWITPPIFCHFFVQFKPGACFIKLLCGRNWLILTVECNAKSYLK
jgi:hypothetical protein